MKPPSTATVAVVSSTWVVSPYAPRMAPSATARSTTRSRPRRTSATHQASRWWSRPRHVKPRVCCSHRSAIRTPSSSWSPSGSTEAPWSRCRCATMKSRLARLALCARARVRPSLMVFTRPFSASDSLRAFLSSCATDITVVGWGAQLHVLEAACKNAEEKLGLQCELIDLRSLLPWDVEAVEVRTPIVNLPLNSGSLLRRPSGKRAGY